MLAAKFTQSIHSVKQARELLRHDLKNLSQTKLALVDFRTHFMNIVQCTVKARHLKNNYEIYLPKCNRSDKKILLDLMRYCSFCVEDVERILVQTGFCIQSKPRNIINVFLS